MVENSITIPFLSHREMVFSTSNPYGQVHIILIPGTFHADHTSYFLASPGFSLLSHLHFFFFFKYLFQQTALIWNNNICAISDIALLWLRLVHPFFFILHSKTTAFLSLFDQREGFGRRVITKVLAPNPQLLSSVSVTTVNCGPKILSTKFQKQANNTF